MCIYIFLWKTCVFKVARQRDKKRDFVACSDHILFSLRNYDLNLLKLQCTVLVTRDAKHICLKENFRRKYCCSVLFINSRHEFVFQYDRNIPAPPPLHTHTHTHTHLVWWKNFAHSIVGSISSRRRWNKNGTCTKVHK